MSALLVRVRAGPSAATAVMRVAVRANRICRKKLRILEIFGEKMVRKSVVFGNETLAS